VEAKKIMEQNTEAQKVVDINDQRSNKTGLLGFVENVFRKFKDLGFFLFLLPIIMVSVFIFGLSLTPLCFYLLKSHQWGAGYSLPIQALMYGLSLGFGILSFIVCLIFIVPIFNFPLLFMVKPYRGPWFSIESMPWYYHNALTYLVRYTILDFITPSPLNILFFKMMGMKIGKGVMINTSNISDPALIELGDHVTIGGSAYMMAHYGMKGFLIIDQLKIKSGAMVGLGAKILGGVTIGEKATVLPNSSVLPKTIIKPKEKFGLMSQVWQPEKEQ